MNNFRWFLEAQGLTPKNIDDAVNEARQVVRMTRGVADFGATILTKLAIKSNPGKKQQILAVGAMLAERLRDGTDKMLKSHCRCYNGSTYCIKVENHKDEHEFS